MDVVRILRASSLRDLLDLLSTTAAIAASLAAILYFAPRSPALAWILLVPIALLLLAAAALVLPSLLDCYLASRRPSNWLAQVGSRGIYLNLRSYRLGAAPEEQLSAVHIAFNEIKSVCKLVEVHEKPTSDGVELHGQKFVQLTLHWPDDIDVLHQACDDQRREVARTTRTMRWRASSLHHSRPVQVEPPKDVRIQWSRELLQALEARLPRTKTQRIDLDRAFADLDVRGRAIALAHRGPRLRGARAVDRRTRVEPRRGPRVPILVARRPGRSRMSATAARLGPPAGPAAARTIGRPQLARRSIAARSNARD